MNVPEKHAKLGVVIRVLAGRAPEVCLIQRAKEPYAGTWALPGGGVEYREDVVSAVVRELGEETGLQTDRFAVRLLGFREFIVDDWHRFHVLADVVRTSGVLRAGDDARDVRWWKVADALASAEVSDYAKACLRQMEGATPR